MILFNTIRWKNFLSTGNQWTEIALDKYNTTLIIGKNGAGKSTLLDALSFVLFGKAFRKINKPQLVNSITQKSLIVEVEFSIGPNEYKVIRGIKPNLFEIYQNETLLNQTAEMIDYQEHLEKHIIKANHKSFCQIVILGTATFQPFMQLTAAQRREIIEDILNLQIFTTMNVLLKEDIASNNEDIVSNTYEKKLVEEKIRLTKEHNNTLRQNNNQLIQDKKDRLISTAVQIAALTDKINIKQEEYTKLESSIEDHTKIDKKLAKMNKIEAQLQNKISVLTKEVEFLNHHDDCPTCKQAIDNTFKCSSIDTKNEYINKYADGLLQLKIEQKDLINTLTTIEKEKHKLAIMNTDISQMNLERLSLEKYQHQLEKEISSFKSFNDEIDDTKLNELQASLDAVQAMYDTLLENKQTMATSASLLKDSGIKAKIIKQYIPIINSHINKNLALMEFMCQFELDEEFNEKLKSRFRDEFSYASFSEGEKMRINLAILFTWRSVAKMRNSINTNLLILDEVFDSSLDSNGTDEFMKIVNTLTKDTNTFIISHKGDQLQDKFDRVITFNKQKNFSRIVK